MIFYHNKKWFRFIIEIKNFITPLVDKIYQLTSQIIFNVNKNNIISSLQKKDLNLFLYQIDIMYNVIDNILKVLHKKYKKEIKTK